MKKTFYKSFFILAFLFVGLATAGLYAQQEENTVIINGARFTNSLFEKWIADYQQLYPNTRFQFDDKGSAEYSNADIIIYGHALEKSEIDDKREYIKIARYAILPVANAKSPFAATYGEKGINNDQIKHIFFYDPIENDGTNRLKAPYNVYTRVQHAPAPRVFAANFGYTQDDLYGRAIAGADLHLIKSILRDSLGITYCPLGLIYLTETGEVVDGLQVIPVDFDGNGRVSNDERFYENLSTALTKLNAAQSKNIPVADIQISFNKDAPLATVQFISWILDKGIDSLAGFGYLDAAPKTLEKERAKLAQLIEK